MNYYIAAGSVQQGPFTVEQLRGMGLRPDTLVWGEGMPQWQPASLVSELQPVLAAAGPPIPYSAPLNQNMSDVSGKKVAAGLCGILLGGLGIHKFILGFTVPGLVLLLITVLTCGMAAFVTHIIGLIEGIIYLTKSDEEFYRTYIIERRQWF
jgi:TM2 domain-containing membrane protein YozV